MASISYAKYFLLSLLGGAGVIYHAFATRQHFFPATVYLSTSKLAVAVVGNLVFASALLGQSLIIKVFLGGLRDIELEMVRERLSSAVMESLLALTVFRDEFGAFFVAMFASLLFLKVLHWLVEDRVDYIEVSPSVSALQHLRITSFLALLLAVDCIFVDYTIQGSIKSGGQSVMVLFAFEYVILATDVFRHSLKYFMSMADLVLMDGGWESKGTYIFYLELITDVLHLFVYVVFFVVVFTNYGLPLHLVRDLYTTFRNFRNRLADFLRFRQVTARLDQLPDATPEDLARSDGVCIICREEMSPTGSNKRLHCNHVFHLQCLRSWLERQQNCPTCRAPVFPMRPPAIRRAAAGAVLADLPGQAPQAAGAARAGAAAAAPAAQPPQEQQPPAAAAAERPPAGASRGADSVQRAAAQQPQQHQHTRTRGGAGRVPAQSAQDSLAQQLQLLRQLAPSVAAAVGAGGTASAGSGAGIGAGSRGHAHAGGAGSQPPGHQLPPPFGLGHAPTLPPYWQPNMMPWGPYGYPGMGGYPPMMMAPPPPGLPPMGAPPGLSGAEAHATGALPQHFIMPPMPSPFFLPPMMPTLLPPLVPTPSPHSVLEQQAAAAAAAAALAAATSVGAYNPQAGLFVMPNIPGFPAMGIPVPPQAAPPSEAPPAGGSSNPAASSLEGQQQASEQPQQHQQQHEPRVGAAGPRDALGGAEALAKEAPVQDSKGQASPQQAAAAAAAASCSWRQ